MYFYKRDGDFAFSFEEFPRYDKATEEEVILSLEEEEEKRLFFLKRKAANKRVSYAITDASMLFEDGDDINIIDKKYLEEVQTLPNWLKKAVAGERVQYLNIGHPFRRRFISEKEPKKWKINIVGLGDVGSNLLLGLKLLGGNHISQIGIYSNNENVVRRYEMEMNQICSPEPSNPLFLSAPVVKTLKANEVMDCDMFVFCASMKVPEIGSLVKDVRMAQYKANREIVSYYANIARREKFKGVFAIVSDPVDLLCKAAYIESNRNDSGIQDFDGLMPEQIQGFGLGIMYARALYYSDFDDVREEFRINGRAYGPHGQGLIIANSIINYDDDISTKLTKRTVEANLRVRDLGYKPFIAPAISSGVMSILARIKGEYHYSSVFIDEGYFGIKNRTRKNGLQIERLAIPEALLDKIKDTHEFLKETY